MPDVMGAELAAARGAVEGAGFEDEIEVEGLGSAIDGPGLKVCGQSPSAGEPMLQVPRLTVGRTCGGGAVSSDDSQPTPSLKPDPIEPDEPRNAETLTTAGNKEFDSLLAVTDYCDDSIASFAVEYAGRTIAFDGSIANLAKHGDYDTRYDILVYPGDKGPESTIGPSFKFEDVNVPDLNLTGAEVPDGIGEGDRFRFTARVDEYNETQCLFYLKPVSTRVR